MIANTAFAEETYYALSCTDIHVGCTDDRSQSKRHRRSSPVAFSTHHTFLSTSMVQHDCSCDRASNCPIFQQEYPLKQQ